MSYMFYNPNPLKNQSAGDCTVRAISKALGNNNWEKTYAMLCYQGFKLCEMPSANRVWGSLLIDNGFEYHSLFNKCGDCYNVIDFCADHPKGTYVLGTDTHAVCCQDGVYWDTFDSGDLIPTYYFEKIKKEETENA